MPQVTGDSEVVGVPAVLGTSVSSRGVQGNSTKDHGVVGHSKDGTGVVGVSENQRGVEGHSTKDHGVVGRSKDGTGVFGDSVNQRGVEGHSTEDHAVVGQSDKGAGILGESTQFEGVRGISHAADRGAVVGINDNPGGVGVFGKGGRAAGHFEGKVKITESLTVQGIDVVGLLRHLQQLEPLFQRLLRLEPILAELEAEFAARSVISVQQETPAHEGVARFHFTGKNFRPGATIKIQVKSSTSAGALRFLDTDALGTLGPIAFLELPCTPGTVLSILAIDEATSQVSSKVTISCT